MLALCTVALSKESDLKPGPALPLRHVAVIMDGNGRWARQRGLPRNEGHRRGVNNVRQIVKCAGEMGLEYLTLYAFSCENWKRPQDEVQALMRLLERFLKSQAKELHKQQLRLRTIGRVHELPETVRDLLVKTCTETAGYTRGTLVLALNYGARTELLDAVKGYGRDVQRGLADPDELTWEALAARLDTAEFPDPDLVIRTSGELRVSNFLLMQSAYAEYYFSKKLWPDFGADDFREAIADYARRERRFGKTGEQVRNLPQESATPG